MLKKRNKLNTQEIKTLFDKKSVFLKCLNKNGELLSIRKYILEKNNQKNTKNFTKYAVLFKKGLFKKAVDRNFIKRKIFSILENIEKELEKQTKKENKAIDLENKSNSVFYLIYPKKNILNTDFYNIKNEIYDIMESIKK